MYVPSHFWKNYTQWPNFINNKVFIIIFTGRSLLINNGGLSLKPILYIFSFLHWMKPY